MKGVEIDAT